MRVSVWGADGNAEGSGSVPEGGGPVVVGGAWGLFFGGAAFLVRDLLFEPAKATVAVARREGQEEGSGSGLHHSGSTSTGLTKQNKDERKETQQRPATLPALPELRDRLR